MEHGNNEKFAAIPMQDVGPLRVVTAEGTVEVMVPLATFETPLWPSVNRGARVTSRSGGVRVVVTDERMTRSVAVEAADAMTAAGLAVAIKGRLEEVEAVVNSTSRFGRFLALDIEQIANLLYLRLAITTGDAAGHNMVTNAADKFLQWLLGQYPQLKYVSISGNFCSDKKTSAVNGLLGRGRKAIAEVTIPQKICQRYLHVEPTAIAELNLKKNLLGSIAAGSLRSANAHYANMLLAFYLATGQDAANIVEGSQGITHAEVHGDDLYFAVTIPHLVVGTVGNGKELGFVLENLEKLGLLTEQDPGVNARRLACLAAATVLCGELSLMAALACPGELMQAHRRYERKNDQ